MNRAAKFNDNLPIKRLLLSALLVYSVISILTVLLTYFRLQHVQPAAAIYCGGTDPQYYTYCIGELVQWLFSSPRWLAVKFSVYIVCIVPIVWRLFRYAQGAPLLNIFILVVLVGVLFGLVGSLLSIEMLVVLIGSLLAGLIIKLNRDRRIKVNLPSA